MATTANDTVVTEQPQVTGGTVETVLATPAIQPPPSTLDEARSQPGRLEQIEQITRRIEAEGIKYVFFQQVSVTGRVMGKGVVSSFFPQVAEKGYQLVYGATANLFTDRAGHYIGFGPEESELAAMADLDTFAVLPWDPRVARVYCDCYDTETGELLDADPRQNLKRVINEFEQELGYSFLIGIEPEMMWMRRGEDGTSAEGVTKPYCYHIHQFEELRPVLLDVVDYGQALGLDMSYGDHEDAPGQLELNFRFDRPVETADNLTTYRQICAAVARKHGLLASFMPKPFTGVSANGRHHHFTVVMRRATTSSTTRKGRRSCPRPAGISSAGCSNTSGALMCLGNPTVNSYSRFWDFGFWAPGLQELGLAEPHLHRSRCVGGRFEFRGSTPPAIPISLAACSWPVSTGSSASSTRARPRARTPMTCSSDGDEPLERVPETLVRRSSGWRRTRSSASALPGRLYDVFHHYKRDEWERYLAAVTDWEREAIWRCFRRYVRDRRDHLPERQRSPAHRADMTPMLQAMKHRGPDSTGYALYRPPRMAT